MKAEPIRKLINALRSNTYLQTRSYLRVGNTFCCLGVACDLYDNTRWSTPSTDYIHAYQKGLDYYTEMPPKSVLDHYGLSSEYAEYLAQMNDLGDSFNTIANKLEADLDANTHLRVA